MSHRRPEYPPARKEPTVDDYHGILVADPYRWLEDPDSDETRAWVDAQNALTRRALAGTRRESVVARLQELYNYPRTSVPVKRGRRLFVTHNTGLQNQPVLYVQDAGGAARALIDTNALAPDGTIALTALEPNDDGTLLLYGLSRSGSDRQELSIRAVGSGRDLTDRILWTRFVSAAWTKDGSGFYYTRFPEPGTVRPEDENYFCSVWFHRLGEPQERDTLVFQAPQQPDTVFQVAISHDDRWTVVTAFQGASDRSEVYLLNRREAQANPIPLFTGFQSAYAFIEAAGGRIFFRTDEGAPRGRIVAVDSQTPATPALEIVPESSDKLSGALVAGGRIAASYQHDASDRVRLFELTGAPAGEIELPRIGSLTGMTGRPEDEDLFLGLTSFTTPPTNHRFDIGTRALELVKTRVPRVEDSGQAVQTDAYVTTQVWYPSKDGTPVSMFLVHRKDLPVDGRRPVLLTGYGGFNVCLTPAYDPANFVLLDAGGIYAVPNLRGGGEYGEAWHEAGMLDRKQNVFDDFIAAAEWLVARAYTSPQKIAIEGGSNGGLLVAAAMLQRPDLFGAVVCRVPVADMLRYHLFTVGRFWVPEYGSADDPEQFRWLLRYSPYHNVQDDVAYPPMLITTADTDDRVSPGMAKKLAARLQAASGGTAPILIRVETRAGHGAGKPVSKLIEEDADVLAFVLSMLEAGR